MNQRLLGPEKGREQVSTSDYLKTIHRIIVRRLPLILILIVGCALAAFVTSKIMKPVYEASTSLRIQKQAAFLQGAGQPVVLSKESLEAEAMWIRSRVILQTVMNELGIGAEAKSKKEALKVLEKLRSKIKVEVIEGSDVLRISAAWNDPVLVKEIVNTLSDVFIEKYTLFTRGKAKETTGFIEEQLEVVKYNLKRAQNKVARFQKEESILSIDQKIASVNSQLTQLETKQADIKMELELARMKSRNLGNKLDLSEDDLETFKSNYSAISANSILSNDLVRSFRIRIAEIESDIVSLSTLYTDEYPLLIQKREELRTSKEKLNKTLCDLVGGLDIADKDPLYQDQLIELVISQIQVDDLENQGDSLELLITDMNKKIEVLPDKQIEYINMVRDASVNEQLYNLLLARLQEARIRERSNEWDIRVFDRAHQPLEPIKPRPIANTVFGAILGLLLGVGVSMMIEYFDDSFRTISDVEEYLQLPVLADIPKIKHRIKGVDRKKKN